MESNLIGKVIDHILLDHLKGQIELLKKENEAMTYHLDKCIEMLAKEDPSMYPLAPTCCLCGSERMDWKPNTKEEQA